MDQTHLQSKFRVCNNFNHYLLISKHLKSNTRPNGFIPVILTGARFQLLQEDIETFVTSELQNFQRILSLSAAEESEDQRLEDLGREDEGSREAFLKIALSTLRKMKEHELADRLQTSKT